MMLENYSQIPENIQKTGPTPRKVQKKFKHFENCCYDQNNSKVLKECVLGRVSHSPRHPLQRAEAHGLFLLPQNEVQIAEV